MNRKEELANKLKELGLTPSIIAKMTAMPERAINDILERGTTRPAYLISLWAMGISPWLLLPVTKESKGETLTALAKKVGLSSRQVLDGYLNKQNSGAQIRFALAMADETGTEVRLWLKGGDLIQRRAAVTAWQNQN